MYKFYDDLGELDLKKETKIIVIFAYHYEDYKKENNIFFKIPMRRIKSNSLFSDQDEEYSLIKDKLIELSIKSNQGIQIYLPKKYNSSYLINAKKIHVLLHRFYTGIKKELGLIDKEEKSFNELLNSSIFKTAYKLFDSKKITLKEK